VTGLVWQRNVPAQTYNWDGAKTYCQGLSLGGMGGWSLPTLIELESIVNFGTFNPSINSTAFPSTPVDYFWAYSAAGDGSGTGWVVQFYGGQTGHLNSFGSYRVRCVHTPTAYLTSASPGAPAGRYTVTTDVITDNTTHLNWQRVVSATTYSWADAATYCNGLNLGGQTGWRLPAQKELQSLVDVRAATPAIDTTAFPSTPAEFFWSSTADPGHPGFSWVDDFDSGLTHYYGQAFTYRVRCVK
jgi:hypothetical protein